MMRNIVYKVIGLFIFSMMGCSSRLDIPVVGDTNGISEKPSSCKVNLSDTCWSEALAAVKSCQVKSTDVLSMSPDQDHCIGEDGPFVEFLNKTQLMEIPEPLWAEQLHFSYARKLTEKDCYIYKGHKDGFNLNLLELGQSVEVRWTDKHFMVQCSGGKVTVFDKQTALGCLESNGPGWLPTAKMTSMSFGSVDGSKDGIQFSLLVKNQAISGFQCKL